MAASLCGRNRDRPCGAAGKWILTSVDDRRHSEMQTRVTSGH
jgi:hypothetical protein